MIVALSSNGYWILALGIGTAAAVVVGGTEDPSAELDVKSEMAARWSA